MAIGSIAKTCEQEDTLKSYAAVLQNSVRPGFGIDFTGQASINAIGRTFHLLAENPVGFGDRTDNVIK